MQEFVSRPAVALPMIWLLALSACGGSRSKTVPALLIVPDLAESYVKDAGLEVPGGRRWNLRCLQLVQRAGVGCDPIRRSVTTTLAEPPSPDLAVRNPQLGQVALGDLAAVAAVDEPGDTVQQACSGRTHQRPVAGVGPQQLQVRGGRVRPLPLEATDGRRPELA